MKKRDDDAPDKPTSHPRFHLQFHDCITVALTLVAKSNVLPFGDAGKFKMLYDAQTAPTGRST